MTPFDSARRYGIRSRAAVPPVAIDITAGYRELADIQILQGREEGEGGGLAHYTRESVIRAVARTGSAFRARRRRRFRIGRISRSRDSFGKE